MNGVLQHLRRAVLPGADGVTDGRLLDDFRARRDEAAFAALLCRHGPMVLGVCRRVLRQRQDAEDAFQATFLVLARKAASIRTQAVGPWLYGVAYRTAMKARAMTAKRRAKERQAGQRPRPETAEDWQELLPVLDRELSRLPERYRAPVVLCELEGKSRKEAAGQLGVPEGTLSSRLARGRVLLARRLGGRAPAAAVGVLALAREASARLPAGLLGSTVGAATGTAPTRVAALTAGVLKMMLLDKLRSLTPLVLALALLGLGVATGAYPMAAGQDAAAPTRPAGGLAIAQKQSAEEKELKRLEGTWEMVAVVTAGEKKDLGKPIRITIRGSAFTADRVGTLIGKGPLKVGAGKTPKTIDFVMTEGPGKGTKALMLYEVKGDELRLCEKTPDGKKTALPRPTEFTAGPGSGQTITTLRRTDP